MFRCRMSLDARGNKPPGLCAQGRNVETMNAVAGHPAFSAVAVRAALLAAGFAEHERGMSTGFRVADGPEGWGEILVEVRRHLNEFTISRRKRAELETLQRKCLAALKAAGYHARIETLMIVITKDRRRRSAMTPRGQKILVGLAITGEAALAVGGLITWLFTTNPIWRSAAAIAGVGGAAYAVLLAVLFLMADRPAGREGSPGKLPVTAPPRRDPDLLEPAAQRRLSRREQLVGDQFGVAWLVERVDRLAVLGRAQAPDRDIRRGEHPGYLAVRAAFRVCPIRRSPGGWVRRSPGG